MKVLKAHDRERHPELFDQMFRGRAEVFHQRLRWPVSVRDGLEIDYYDEECDPAYLGSGLVKSKPEDNGSGDA
uniref:acyl-homoserine-lactone synthase n=1 Tax=Brucella intermedia TaxID=94625 RepID=UPI002360520E